MCCPEGLAGAQQKKKEHNRSQDDAAKHDRLHDLNEDTADVQKKAASGAAGTDENVKPGKKVLAKKVAAKKVAPKAKQGRGAKAGPAAADKKGPRKGSRALTQMQAASSCG